MHGSQSQVLRLAARAYQKQEGTCFTPSQFNSPARVREKQEGDTEAPRPCFPGNKATVPRIWRVLYRKKCLFCVQDTQVSLVLEKPEPLFWIQWIERHACSPAALFPLSSP